MKIEEVKLIEKLTEKVFLFSPREKRLVSRLYEVRNLKIDLNGDKARMLKNIDKKYQSKLK
jgi:hypothetical protein